MANCEQNILDLPVQATAPAASDVIIITHSDGSSSIVQYSVFMANVPSDIEFKVGDVDFPQDGDSTMTLASNINRIRLIRNHVPQSTIDDGGGWYFLFNSVTKLLTVHPNYTDEELIQIQPY